MLEVMENADILLHLESVEVDDSLLFLVKRLLDDSEELVLILEMQRLHDDLLAA